MIEYMESFMTVFLLLVVCHCLADYPLQGDFLSKAKNPFAPIPGVPWWQAMAAHSIIHAGFVGIITGSILLAICELVIHFVIDYLKCAKQISYNTDQVLHVWCKLCWVMTLPLLAS